jgi:hypothetical protein
MRKNTTILILTLAYIIGAYTMIGGTATASAESCFRVVGTERGTYTTSTCGVAGAPRNWTWAGNTFGWDETPRLTVYCVRVGANLQSWFQSRGCSIPLHTVSGWSEVYAEPGFFWGIIPLQGKGNGNQVFSTTAGTVECEESSIGGKATATEPKTQIFTIKYGKCKGFGSPITISEAEYELTAKGAASVVNKSITMTDSEAKCTVTIPSGSGNKSLRGVKYTNTEAGRIIAAANIGGLHYEPSGGVCGENKLESGGTYKGEVEIEQEGTSIAVVLHPFRAGPQWHRRAKGEKGEGSEIGEEEPESMSGKGGEQTLKGKIATIELVVTSPGVQIKGAIADNARQGQIKEELIYRQPELRKPELKGCVTTLGTNNIVQLKGRLMWKWNGEKKQLEEEKPAAGQTPGVVFTAVEPQGQGTGTQALKEGVIMTMTFKGSGCAILAGTFDVNGSELATPNINLEGWSNTLSLRTADHKQGSGRALQHYWTGEEFQGAEAGLTISSNAASLLGQTEMEASQQEIAIFED